MQPQAKTLNPKEVLRRLPQNESFHFFIDINDYSGKSAHNLAQFCKIINTINKKSIIFHFERHDFERWTGGTLHDPTLARRINKLKKLQTEEELSEEKVRTLIHHITKNRIKELKNRLPNKRHKTHSKSTKAKKQKNTKRIAKKQQTRKTKQTTKQTRQTRRIQKYKRT
jgi:hypothetical protein